MRALPLTLVLLLGPAAWAQGPAVFDVPDLEAATLDALPAPPGPSRAGKLLAAGEHAKLDALLTRARKAGRRPDSFTPWLTAHLATLTDSHALPQLDAWCRAAPRSAYAALARGEAWLGAALRMRGSGPAKDIDPARAKRIAARLRQAEADLARASELDPKLARPHALRISIDVALGADDAVLLAHFDRAVALDANDVTAHIRLLEALSPAYGGSWAAMFQFAEKCAAAGKTEPALYLVLGLAHERAARASKDPAGYLARPRVRDTLRPAFKALAEAYPSALPALRLRARLDALRKHTATRATWRALLADAGDADALYRLGAADDSPAGLRKVLRAAYLGSARAARRVGLLLKAKKRWEPCAAWIQVAHDRGDLDAAFDLGLLKWRGRGVPQDPRSAVSLFKIAAAGARPAVAEKARKWLEYVVNKRPELLRKKKP